MYVKNFQLFEHEESEKVEKVFNDLENWANKLGLEHEKTFSQNFYTDDRFRVSGVFGSWSFVFEKATKKSGYDSRSFSQTYAFTYDAYPLNLIK